MADRPRARGGRPLTHGRLSRPASPSPPLVPRPYEATDTEEQKGAACLQLQAPLGSGLALTVRPGEGLRDDTGAFVVELDPRRVLYGRVLWRQQGLTWSLEGRADPAELLDLAREVAARVRVEGPDDRI